VETQIWVAISTYLLMALSLKNVTLELEIYTILRATFNRCGKKMKATLHFP
jgi:hypothetical protein